MNELYQLKRLERNIDMWMEDVLFLSFFERDTEAEFGKEARAAKRAKAKNEVEDQHPFKKLIKKPSTQQINVSGKRKVPCFY